MSPILVPSKRPWTQQPHLPAALSPRCAGALVIDGRFDRIVGGRPASTKQLGFGLGSQGISARASGTGSRNDYPVPPTLISSSGDFTLALFLEQKSAQSGSYAYAFGSPGCPIAFAMRHSATSYNADLALGRSTHVNTGINASAAGVYKIVARRIAGTIYFNINGQKSSVANATTLGTITSLILNSYTNTSGYGVSGETNFYLALLDSKRGWSDAEADAFVANPWSIYRARDLETIFAPADGGNLAAQASGAGQSSGSADLQAQVALAGVGVSLASGQTTPSVAIPLSAAGISVAGGSANGIATVSLSAAGLAQAAGQAGLSASVLLAAAGAAQAAGNTTLATLLNAQAAGAGQAGGSANLTGGAPGALSASGGDVASGLAVLSVSVKLQATGSGQAGGSANGMASAPGALSASGQANAAGFATWSALVTLTAAGFVQAMGAGSFQVSIPLSAGGTAQASGVAQASMAGLVNRFALQAREKCLTETTASVWRVALIETDVARMTRLVHEVKHV